MFEAFRASTRLNNDGEEGMPQERAIGKSRILYRSAVSQNNLIMTMRNTVTLIASRFRRLMITICNRVIAHSPAQHHSVKCQQHDQPERDARGAGNAA